MNPRRLAPAVLFLSMVLWVDVAAALDCRRATPLPSDAEITAPAKGVPEEIARFAGAWNGAWRLDWVDVLCTSLVVERVHANGFAEVIYSHGSHDPWDIPAAGYSRAVGRVQDGQLRFRTNSGARFAFRLGEPGLVGTRNGKGDVRLVAIEGLDRIGCRDAPKSPGRPAGGTRSELSADELMNPPADGGGLTHNSQFMPAADAEPARHALKGVLRIQGGPMLRSAQGCPGTERQLAPVSISFFTEGEHLIPVERGIVHPPESEGRTELIFGIGRVWSEPGDRGLSRASFPFAVTSQTSSAAHNGLATFVYDDTRVSPLRFQIIQETAPFRRIDFWGALPTRYEPGPVPEESRLRAEARKELADRLPRRPLAELEARLGPAVAEAFPGFWGRKHVSATGLLFEGTIYHAPCPTRWGDYPYCGQMRHGVASVTKSMAAALSLFWLAQKYGDDVLDLKIKDYLEVTAVHDGWAEVTFADALNMATGVGRRAPDPEPNIAVGERGWLFRRWARAPTAQEKLDLAFAFGDYPWGPGRFARYDTTHTFLLAAAMDAFLKKREGTDARLWDGVVEEVLRPIGVHHAPLLHTIEPDGADGIPIMGYGLYASLDDAAKIARLLQDDGRYGKRQILSRAAVREALYRTDRRGLPTGRKNRFGEEGYHMSFWQTPYQTEAGCHVEIPSMRGFGGNIVDLYPNGAVGFRFSDGFNFETETIAAAAEALRPFCQPTGEQAPRSLPGDPVAEQELRDKLAGATIYADNWHGFWREDRTIFGRDKRDRLWIGSWRFNKAGRFCIRIPAYREGIERCHELRREGEDLLSYPLNGWGFERLRIVEGNPEGY